MIIAFSTSSRFASVAAIQHSTPGGTSPSSGVEAESRCVLWSGELEAPHAASGACLSLLDRCLCELGSSLADTTMFAADLGPGSFTGVRVGIVLAKSFGFLHGVPCAGASAFELIDPDGVVILPSRRGEVFVRRPGVGIARSTTAPEEPFSGNGLGLAEEVFPKAAGFARLLDRLVPVRAEQLVPEYLIEPSISVPKRAFARGVETQRS